MTRDEEQALNNDLHDIRKLFINDLANRMVDLVSWGYDTEGLLDIFKEMLEKRLPSALEVRYPTIE